MEFAVVVEVVNNILIYLLFDGITENIHKRQCLAILKDYEWLPQLALIKIPFVAFFREKFAK